MPCLVIIINVKLQLSSSVISISSQRRFERVSPGARRRPWPCLDGHCIGGSGVGGGGGVGGGLGSGGGGIGGNGGGGDGGEK